MTLTAETLSIIEDNWPGGVPNAVVFVDRDEAGLNSDGGRTGEYRNNILVEAAHAGSSESRGGFNVTEVVHTVAVRVRGLAESERGELADHPDATGVFDAVKQALRARQTSAPPTVSPHTETFHEMQISSTTEQSAARASVYEDQIDVDWYGHT